MDKELTKKTENKEQDLVSYLAPFLSTETENERKSKSFTIEDFLKEGKTSDLSQKL